MIPVITIDGPSGSGKGTISRLVAEELGFHLLDSGALYRLTALAAMRHGVELTDEQALAEVSSRLDVVFNVRAQGTQILLESEDVTEAIRAEEVGMNASHVAAFTAVRQALLDRQRAFAQAPGLVADGRDMGTVVFPGAPVKIFLTASAEERAHRRLKQLQAAGQQPDYDQILRDIEARDEKDSSRAAAPLVPASDAVLLDSTKLTIDEVFQAVLQRAEAVISRDVIAGEGNDQNVR